MRSLLTASSMAAFAAASTLLALAGCSTAVPIEARSAHTACEDEAQRAVGAWWQDEHGVRPRAVEAVRSDDGGASSSEVEDTVFVSGTATIDHDDTTADVRWVCRAHQGGSGPDDIQATISAVREQ